MKRILIALILFSLLVGCAAPAAPATTSKPTTAKPAPSAPSVTELLQQALVATAHAYYLRGARAQYDQTSFTQGASRSVSRRSTAIRKPEDYTSQYFGYHDCSSFVFDVYWSALGMDISEGPTKRNTKSYMSNPHRIIEETLAGNNFTAEQIEQKRQTLRDALQIGDILVYRKKGNSSGHAMLYVGDGKLIHSAGGDYTGMYETHEKSGTYRYDDIEGILSDTENTRYLFKQHAYVVLRPLTAFDGAIPSDTIARMGVMRDVMAEKIASHTFGQSVNVGDEVTFTFHIENHGNEAKTLTVTDTVPAGTTYISGAEAANGDSLSWTVTLAAGESRDVSYTVTVNAGTKTVQSESDVSGIAVNCPAIIVAGTLTADQQQAIAAAWETEKESASGLALADAIYNTVLGRTYFGDLTTEELLADLLPYWNETDMDINVDSTFASMVVPRLYGGILLVEQNKNDAYRTRLLQPNQLIVGDLILADNEVYLFLGDTVVDLDTDDVVDHAILEWFGGYYAFVVLRPSMG